MVKKIDNEYKKVKREHVYAALNYISVNGKPGRHDILHVDENPRARAMSRALKYNGKRFSVREVMRVALLCYYGEELSEISDYMKKIREIVREKGGIAKLKEHIYKPILIINLEMFKKEDFVNFKDSKKITAENENENENEDEDENEDDDVDGEAYNLLKCFRQIIFTGPPGTGKTRRAMKVLPHILNIEEKDITDMQGYRWDIVQFHPSYNYEDFVRGVKVKTTNDNNVEYTTENRIFGDICQRAKNDPDNGYLLIIDEINRANVSAVLGELIYALEYRDKEIKTPYSVGKKKNADMLVIPKNLYIIGTMNTADRTIGQIDYAVRRRFAFVYCPPSCEVIEEHVENARVVEIYNDVQKLFEEGKERKYLSQDYDADDVRIGHSYFLHDKTREGDISRDMQISQKIIYQVVPILREYVKDGVFLSEAEDEIDEIEKEAKRLSGEEVEDEGTEPDEEQDESPQNRRFSWKNGERNSNDIIVGMRRTVLSIVKDFVEDYKKKNGRDITIEELREWFPDKAKHTKGRGIKLKEDLDHSNKDSFFTKEGDELKVDGKTAYVTRNWGYRGTHSPGEWGSFHDFKEEIEKKGYKIDEHLREE